MRAVLFHPLGVTLLAGSLLLAGAVRFLPGVGGLSAMAPGVLFLGTVGYTALVVALLWPGPAALLPSIHRLDSDLSDPAVKKRLRLDALRHPATLLPLALAGTAACYLALLAPATGGGLAAMAAIVVSVAAAVGAFLWHYAVRHRQRYVAMVHWLTAVSEEARAKAEQADLARLRERLEEGFPSVGSTLGLRALRGLDEEFFKLGPVLEGPGDTVPLSLSAVPAMAGEAYHRGLKVLADALELMRAVDGPERGRLEAEISELEGEIESSTHDDSQRPRTLILEDTLASHRQRLGMQEQLRLRADQLLHLAGRCEATLHRTRVELAGIRAGGLESGVDPVLEALQETVRRAKEVQEELRKLGY